MTGSDAPDPFVQIGAALDLIATYHPNRLTQIRRDIGEIWIRRHPASRALWDLSTRTCIIDLQFVSDPVTAPDHIAASIVHEATHARIDHWQIPYDELRRARIERLCRRAELDLGRRLPNGSGVIERAEAILALDDTHIAWSSKEWNERRLAATELAVSELALPRWLRQLLIHYARKRAA